MVVLKNSYSVIQTLVQVLIIIQVLIDPNLVQEHVMRGFK